MIMKKFNRFTGKYKVHLIGVSEENGKAVVLINKGSENFQREVEGIQYTNIAQYINTGSDAEFDGYVDGLLRRDDVFGKRVKDGDVSGLLKANLQYSGDRYPRDILDESIIGKNVLRHLARTPQHKWDVR